MPDRISWFIDDRPVKMGGWGADMTAHGGFRDFRGTAVGNFLFAEQESPVVGYRKDGSVFWYGTMTLDPEITEAGAAIQAEGLFKQDFSTKSGRTFFLSRDVAVFSDASADPYLYLPVPGQTFGQRIDAGQLVWTQEKNADYTVGDETGWVCWVPDTVLTNFSATLATNAGGNPEKVEYILETASVPAGSPTIPPTTPLVTTTQEGAAVLSSATSIDRALVNTSGDLVRLRVRRNAAAGKGDAKDKLEGYVGPLELRGLAPTSIFTVEQVLRIVLQLDGRIPNVEESAQDAMPLDFTGTKFDLANYVTKLADWWFMILQADQFGTFAEAGPWSDVITIARKKNIRTSLTPLRRYNTVRVPYSSTGNDEQFAVAVASPDPFPGETVEFLSDALADVQSGTEAPDAIARTLVARYSKIRRAGSIQIGAALSNGKPLSPYQVRPAVLADIQDHDPGIPPQRVESVGWNSDGTVTASIESEVSAVATLRSSQSAPRSSRTRSS